MQPVWLNSMLKARSAWPQTCLDLLYLDWWPSSCAISPVCLPWNAATDSNSSLEQQGIIWKGWQNQHTVCRLSPCYSGSFGSAVCSEHQRPVRDVGLKGGDAQFNQTFGCLCVQGHEPPSQRNPTLRKTMGRHHPFWSKETWNVCICPCFFN